MDTTTFRAQAALNRRAAAFGPVRCACRAFGTWMRDGATLSQAARVAAATFRAMRSLRPSTNLPELL